MKYIIRQLRTGKNYSKNVLKNKAAEKLRIDPEEISGIEVIRRSIDARGRNPGYVITAAVSTKNESVSGAEPLNEIPPFKELESGSDKLPAPVYIAGAGPAGLFAALLLAEKGYKPIVLEKGPPAPERYKAIEEMRHGGTKAPDADIYSGEGGAGLYTDGKLNTRVNHPYTEYVLETLCDCGAPPEIRFDAKPHIGSDLLPGIIVNLRKKIETAGGTFTFRTALTDIDTSSGQVSRIIFKDTSEKAGALIGAFGSSAYETISTLIEKGVPHNLRGSLIGLRVEHRQHIIDRAFYGNTLHAEHFGPAAYFIKYRGFAPVHSFCMCPGGEVLPCAGSGTGFSTNGMSRSRRDSGFANSAIITPIRKEDLGDSYKTAISFLHGTEARGAELSGGKNILPAQSVQEFLKKKTDGKLLPAPKSTKRQPAPLQTLLPVHYTRALEEALLFFCKKIPGFSEGTLYGPETRTGSVIQFVRSSDHTIPGFSNMYLCGEGAGHSGGITSSAVDGLKTAEALIKKYKRPDFSAL
ncbi:MAG: NAD(P)/FAD-dependent oxidoreductase [Fibrobacterota bacterium]